jgi:hypothetical protein
MYPDPGANVLYMYPDPGASVGLQKYPDPSASVVQVYPDPGAGILYKKPAAAADQSSKQAINLTRRAFDDMFTW